MTIKSKIMGCFVAVLALFAFTSICTYFRSKQTNERLILVNEVFLPVSRQIVQLQSNIAGLSEDMQRFYFRRTESQTSENSSFSRMVRDLYPYIIQKRFLTIERLLSKLDPSGKKAATDDLTVLLNRAHSTFDSVTATTEGAKFDTLLSELKGQVQAISKKVDEECQKLTRAVQEEGRENIFASSALSVLVVVVGFFVLLISHRVLNPLPILISSIKKIADGDFHQSLKVKAADEGDNDKKAEAGE